MERPAHPFLQRALRTVNAVPQARGTPPSVSIAATRLPRDHAAQPEAGPVGPPRESETAMSVLVVAEHNDHLIDPAILSTVSAARQCSGDVHVLVAGALPGNAAKQASRIVGVSTVVRADAPVFRGEAADEALTTQIAALAPRYSSILLPASERGCMLAAKVAERLGVRPIADVTKVVHRNTAETEVHAGGRVMHVSRTTKAHVMTVRPSAFEAAAEVGGMASFASMEAVV